MSAAAVMVCRDEADIIGHTLMHTINHVDEVFVTDHRSTDGTRELLGALKADGMPLQLSFAEMRGFHEDRIRTMLAALAYQEGHEWVVVVDADDIWHVPGDVAGAPTVRVADWLAALPPEVMVASGDSYNHVATGADDAVEADPVVRMRWRERGWDAHKVACRLHERLGFHNHAAWYGGEYRAPDAAGLMIRHFTIRTPEQLVRKVRNGLDSFSEAAGMPHGHDESWVQWKGLTEDQIVDEFYARFFVRDPEAVPERLVYDPAP